MADTLPTSSAPDANKSFKEQFVPLEDRSSRHLQSMVFYKDLITTVTLLALGSIGGYFAGKELEPKKIKLGVMAKLHMGTDQVDRISGTYMGGVAGAVYSLFGHWRKTHGKEVAVENLSSDLKIAVNPAQLQAEAEKEQMLLNKLQELQDLHAQTISRTAQEAERRETIGVIER